MTALSDEETALVNQLLPLVQQIDRRMDRLEDRMTALEVGVAELRGRVSQIPTYWQTKTITIIAMLVIAVMVGTVGVVAGSLAISRHPL
jgi:hypothetical protein